jgi:hypothetical protein
MAELDIAPLEAGQLALSQSGTNCRQQKSAVLRRKYLCRAKKPIDLLHVMGGKGGVGKTSIRKQNSRNLRRSAKTAAEAREADWKGSSPPAETYPGERRRGRGSLQVSHDFSQRPDS